MPLIDDIELVKKEHRIRQPYWRDWPGNSSFCCQGRFMIGSDATFMFVTLVLLTGPMFAYEYYIGRQIHIAVDGVCGFLYLMTMFFLFRAAFTDPGVIPRSNVPKPDPLRPNRLHGRGYKYCNTCKLFRPPRAKHCRYCDNCVLQFDHHCPWVGTCVGQRNYRYFVMFVFSVVLLSGFTFATSVTVLVQDSMHSNAPGHQINRFADAIATNPASLALTIFSGFVLLSVLGLATYHTNLISIGQTTNENMRNVYRRLYNPYNKGCRKNCKITFFSKQPTSRVLIDPEEEPIHEGLFPPSRV